MEESVRDGLFQLASKFIKRKYSIKIIIKKKTFVDTTITKCNSIAWSLKERKNSIMYFTIFNFYSF